MPAKLDDAVRDAILDALRASADGTAERSRSSIAREHGVAPSTVTKLARDHGIADAFDRTQTAHASRARGLDNRARRAALSAGMLDDAEHLRERLRAAAVVVTANGSKVNLTLPPLADVRQAASAITGFVKASLDVDQRDAADDSHTAVDEWLRGIIGDGVADGLEAAP